MTTAAEGLRRNRLYESYATKHAACASLGTAALIYRGDIRPAPGQLGAVTATATLEHQDRTVLVVEIGVLRGHIVTQNLICAARTRDA